MWDREGMEVVLDPTDRGGGTWDGCGMRGRGPSRPYGMQMKTRRDVRSAVRASTSARIQLGLGRTWNSSHDAIFHFCEVRLRITTTQKIILMLYLSSHMNHRQWFSRTPWAPSILSPESLHRNRECERSSMSTIVNEVFKKR